MRDPKRIKRILELIEGHWSEYPDTRLCQLLIAKLNQSGQELTFNTEDDVLEEALKR